MEKDAVIIGGSIAGLMCGIMLKHHGYNVTILEKEAQQSREGYDAGIKIGDEVQCFLDKHDRVKREMVIVCSPNTLIDVTGKPRAQRGQTITNTNWGLLVNVLRANFDGLTSDAVPNPPESRAMDGRASFRSGARVTSFEEDGDKVKVHFEDVKSSSAQTMEAGMLIVADGSNSAMRSILLPEIKREYCGYMCWRGTICEDDLDEKWNELYSDKATFHLMKQTYLLNYTIPTDAGELTKGKRLHNWIWYSNLLADSTEMSEVFTDVNGKFHHGTVPRGLVRPEQWRKLQERAEEMLPEGLAAIVRATRTPFLTKIYEVAATKASFMKGKVFLVGDAQVTLRPNIAMSSTHAAVDCNELEKVIEGTSTSEQWEGAVLKWGAAQRRFAMTISAYGLGTWPSVAWNGMCWLGLLAGQRLGML